LRYRIFNDRQISSPTADLPGGEEPKPATIEGAPADSPGALETDVAAPRVLVWNDTREAGLYRLNWLETPGGSATELFAVNPDARESDLTRISAAELKKLWRGLEPEIITTSTATDGHVDVQGQEIWRSLMYWMLAMLGTESCFATWVGRQR
jgi:hypothetical protein